MNKDMGLCEVYINKQLKTTAKVNFVTGEVFFNNKNRIFPKPDQNLSVMIIEPVFVDGYFNFTGIGGRYFVTDHKNVPTFKEHYLSNKLKKEMPTSTISTKKLKI